MVPMEMPLAELLEVFTEQNVGVLPVAEKAGSDHIVGIVDQRDLLRTLHLTRERHLHGPPPGQREAL